MIQRGFGIYINIIRQKPNNTDETVRNIKIFHQFSILKARKGVGKSHVSGHFLVIISTGTHIFGTCGYILLDLIIDHMSKKPILKDQFF